MLVRELLDEGRSRGKKNKTWTEKIAPPDALISKGMGGGKIKELVEYEMPSEKILHYSLAYINQDIYRGDHGRVLGYDNSHDYAHKHLMGDETPEEMPETLADFGKLKARFEKEWYKIARTQLKGKKMIEEEMDEFDKEFDKEFLKFKAATKEQDEKNMMVYKAIVDKVTGPERQRIFKAAGWRKVKHHDLSIFD